jgi:hypothetical protein
LDQAFLLLPIEAGELVEVVPVDLPISVVGGLPLGLWGEEEEVVRFLPDVLLAAEAFAGAEFAEEDEF